MLLCVWWHYQIFDIKLRHRIMEGAVCDCWTWTSGLDYWTHQFFTKNTLWGQHKQQQQPKFKDPSWLFEIKPSRRYLSSDALPFASRGYCSVTAVGLYREYSFQPSVVVRLWIRSNNRNSLMQWVAMLFVWAKETKLCLKGKMYGAEYTTIQLVICLSIGLFQLIRIHPCWETIKILNPPQGDIYWCTK